MLTSDNLDLYDGTTCRLISYLFQKITEQILLFWTKLSFLDADGFVMHMISLPVRSVC